LAHLHCGPIRSWQDDSKRAGCGGGIAHRQPVHIGRDTSGGNLPSFTNAAPPADGERLYDYIVLQACAPHPVVATGRFGADMKVWLMNDGPVTVPLRIAPAGASV